MDYSSQTNDFVNPADLYASYDYSAGLDTTIKSELDFLENNLASTTADEYSGAQELAGSHQDSAIDLRGFYNTGYPCVKTEFPNDFDSFVNTQYSTPASNTSNTPSPHGDMIFSNANSPGDYTRDQSQTSSPEANNEMLGKDSWDYRASTDDVILIPQSVDPCKVTIFVDKNKTRAETQIKTLLVLDPLPRQFQWVRFPRHTLSKSKQLASDDEVATNEDGNSSVKLDLTLVCATTVEKPDGLDRALRRARGDEPTPTRPKGTQVAEIDKDDPAHPQNGGAVIICEGCKERERKRYDRKKKRNQDEENEWNNYEDQRIIMINEKEFKKWQDVESGQQHGPEAKKVEFAMRITCYCRHQEEKSPVGYKVIFTFKDTNNMVLAQKVSEIIQITDDHKNREMPITETLTTDLAIHPPPHQDAMSNQYNMPMYNNYTSPPMYGMYSQPTTPVLSQTFTPLSPLEAQYPQSATSSIAPQATHQPAYGYANGLVTAATPTQSFASHQRYQSYSNTPMLSPTENFSPQAGYPLHRPHSLDSFSAAFANMYPQQSGYSQPFASQPPSRNVSRPASPSWDQGPSRGTKKMRAVPGFFMVEDPDNE